MPTQIDYAKRGILTNIFDPGAWQNMLGGISTIVGGTADVFAEMERLEGSKGLTEPPPPPPYDPNLTWRDYKFTPNVKLIIGGVVLLGVALVIRKK